MFKNILCRLILSVIFILSLVLPDACFGQYYRSNNRRNELDNSDLTQGRNGQLTKEQIMLQQADASAQKLSLELQELLTNVNSNSKPNEQLLSNSEDSIKNSGKYASKYFNDNLKAEYYMLTSWVSYYRGDIKKAYLTSGTAIRSDEDNNDARATQAAMAILAGRKPMPIKTPRPVYVSEQNYDTGRMNNNMMRSQRTRSTRRTRPDQFQQSVTQIQQLSFTGSSGNILDIDVANIDTRMIGQEISAFQFKCSGNKVVDYTPGNGNLCLLFWSVPIAQAQNFSEPNNNSLDFPNNTHLQFQNYTNVAPPRMIDNDFNPGYSGRSARPLDDPSFIPQNIPARKVSVTKPFEVYKQYYDALASNKSFQFVSINIDDLEHSDKVNAFQAKHNYPWPQTTIHMMPDTFFAVAAKTIYIPSLVIVNKEGMISYAGPVDCFITRLLFESMMPGKSFSLDTEPEKSSTSQNPLDLLKAASEKMNAVSVRRTPPETAKPVVKPNTSYQKPLVTDGFTAAQKYEAEQMKLNVINFYNFGRKIPNNYHKSIDYYRELLAKYPDSEYTLEAREYIRKIPERYQKRYNVTKEELGY